MGHVSRFFHRPPQTQKGKEVICNQVKKDDLEFFYKLEILVGQAVSIDECSGASFVKDASGGTFRVYVSDKTETQSFEDSTISFADPNWNRVFEFIFDEKPIGEYLKLEILEEDFGGGDPMTSDGDKVIGRARIVFPEQMDVIVKRKALLINLDKGTTKLTGFIRVQLRLSKHRIFKGFNGFGGPFSKRY